MLKIQTMFLVMHNKYHARTMMARLFFAVSLSFFMLGCQTTKIKEGDNNVENNGENTTLTSTQQQTEAALATNARGAQRSEVRREVARQKVIHQLLRSAQAALKKDQLTSPKHENAFDFFQSVLALDKDNPHAQSGLQSILIRYASWIRKALKESDFDRAQSYLKTSQSVFKASPLLNQLADQLQKDREAARLASKKLYLNKPFDDQARPDFYALDSSELNARSPYIIDYIKSIAGRIEQSGESVLIYARTDREGRWIYQQLNRAIKGYRVRGDIRISRESKIVLLPPL